MSAEQKRSDLTEMEMTLNSLGEAVGAALVNSNRLLDEIVRRPKAEGTVKEVLSGDQSTHNRVQDATKQMRSIMANVEALQGRLNAIRNIVGDSKPLATPYEPRP